MSKLVDLTGNRYGDLVVVKRAENAPGGIAVWECLCDCGQTTLVRGNNLKRGAVKSCGCRRSKVKPTLRHGMSKTRLYREWAAIKRRCYLKTDPSYKNYGGRGIGMCDSWKNSFELFAKWATNNGYSDELTIERINVNGNYCPENCKWIPWSEQQGNRTYCRFYTYNGETKNLVEWCKQFNLPYGTVHNRIYKLKWTFQRAISEPIHIEKRNISNV